MTTEEKAKAYEKAIETARELMKNGYEYDMLIQEIFPKLKESEDERIKQWLIHTAIPSIQCNRDWKRKVIALLEKQGESYTKQQLRDMGFPFNLNGDIVTPKEQEKDLKAYIENEKKKWLEKHGEQSPDEKIEPKFKVGDWIVNVVGDICLITEVDLENQYYLCVSNLFGKTDGDITLTDKNYHLWTINDAEDGDVLAVNNEVFIYAHRKQLYNIAVTHCFVDSAGGFYLDGEFGYSENGNPILPATKEQRNLLFQKMKEAGYEWDAEKKELKKIEQKPAEWNEEDETRLQRIIDFLWMNRKGDTDTIYH